MRTRRRRPDPRPELLAPEERPMTRGGREKDRTSPSGAASSPARSGRTAGLIRFVVGPDGHGRARCGWASCRGAACGSRPARRAGDGGEEEPLRARRAQPVTVRRRSSPTVEARLVRAAVDRSRWRARRACGGGVREGEGLARDKGDAAVLIQASDGSARGQVEAAPAARKGQLFRAVLTAGNWVCPSGGNM
jgi:uncharacterized protein